MTRKRLLACFDAAIVAALFLTGPARVGAQFPRDPRRPTTAGAASLPESLDDVRRRNVEAELWTLNAQQASEPVPSRRQHLFEAMTKSVAKSFDGVTTEDLARKPGIIQQLWRLVDLVAPLPPPEGEGDGKKPGPIRLEERLRYLIKIDLEGRVAESPRVPYPLMRIRLLTRAERIAEEALGFPTQRIAQDLDFRAQLLGIVDEVYPTSNTPDPRMPSRTPPRMSTITATPTPTATPMTTDTPTRAATTTPRRAATATPTIDADGDGETVRRCECIYCHYQHAAGTCSLPYPPVCPPPVPLMMPYAAAPSYFAAPIAYAPRRHPLHGLFCPCAWCRGW